MNLAGSNLNIDLETRMRRGRGVEGILHLGSFITFRPSTRRL